MLQIHYGRERLNKDKFLFEHIQGETLLIVPDQYTLQAERDAFFYLGKKGFMDLQVVGISRLGSIVLKEVGGGRDPLINKQGRHMLLTKIMVEENKNLAVYGNYRDNTAFIEMANNFISEMKQYNVSPNQLSQIVETIPKDGFLSRKLTDIHRLYHRYEELISGKYTDTEDYMGIFIDKISQSKTIGRQTVWISGFDSFTPKNIEVIQQLRLAAKEVHLVMTWDREGADRDLFRITETMMNKLQPDDTSQIGDECIEPKNPAIATLEAQLFAMPAKPSSLEEGITLVAAANIYGEGETAAGYILELVREKGLLYRDILVICNDLNTRGSIYKRVFAEYGIELFVDTKRDIMHSPAVNYILALLDILGKGYRTEDIFRLLKTGLSNVIDEEIEDLQNYGAKYKVRGSSWKKPFEKGISDRIFGVDEETRKAQISRIDGIREKVISPISAFGTTFKEAKTVEGRVRALYDYLSGPAMLPEKIETLLDQQTKEGRLELAQETGQIWNIAMDNLDQLVAILGDETLPMETFGKLLTAGFESVEVGILPPTLDGLMMGTMQRTRSGKVKAMVVLGANQGVLPQEKGPDTLLSEDEKMLLLENNIEICKVDQIRSMEENLAIYRNLTKATDYLWIGYAGSDDKGTSIRPSSIFEKIREIFPAIKVEKDVLNRNEPMDYIQAPDATLRHLTAALREAKAGAPLPKIWESVVEWYRENRSEQLDAMGRGLSFSTKLEPVPKDIINQLYKISEDTPLSLSPSRLEKFGRCPFAHFVRYGLRPEEGKPYQVGPIEMGDIYHRCLMQVSNRLTKGDSLWMTISKKEAENLVSEFMAQEKIEFGEGILASSKEQEYRSQRIQTVCNKAVWMMITHVRQGQIEAMEFEESFGRGQPLRPIEIQVGGEKVLIEGKIDRIDYLPDNRVKIIDYKSGTDAFSEIEATSGWKLQLMVYLRAAMEDTKQPAGVFYFHIQEPKVDGSLLPGNPKEIEFQDKLEDEIRKSFMMDGAMIDDPEIIAHIAGEDLRIIPLKSRKNLYSPEEFAAFQKQVDKKIASLCTELSNGNINISPLKIKENTACKYCEYNGICMFDNRMEGCYYVLA